MKKGKKIIASVVLALLAVLGIGGFVYVSDYYHADDDALKALELQGDGVQVEQDGAVFGSFLKTLLPASSSIQEARWNTPPMHPC